MSRFTETLTVSPLNDGRTWILREVFGYDVGEEDGKDIINVPIDFMTDFASVPGIFTSILPRWGKYGNAAVIHDYLYWEQNRVRKEADSIFLEGMEILDVSWLTRHIMYWMVRLFGYLAWKGNQNIKKQNSSRFALPRPIKFTEKAKAIRAPLDYVKKNIPEGVGKLL